MCSRIIWKTCKIIPDLSSWHILNWSWGVNLYFRSWILQFPTGNKYPSASVICYISCRRRKNFAVRECWCHLIIMWQIIYVLCYIRMLTWACCLKTCLQGSPVSKAVYWPVQVIDMTGPYVFPSCKTWASWSSPL